MVKSLCRLRTLPARVLVGYFVICSFLFSPSEEKPYHFFSRRIKQLGPCARGRFYLKTRDWIAKKLKRGWDNGWQQGFVFLSHVGQRSKQACPIQLWGFGSTQMNNECDLLLPYARRQYTLTFIVEVSSEPQTSPKNITGSLASVLMISRDVQQNAEPTRKTSSVTPSSPFLMDAKRNKF